MQKHLMFTIFIGLFFGSFFLLNAAQAVEPVNNPKQTTEIDKSNITDRRKAETMIDDEKIESDAKEKLKALSFYDKSHIVATSYNGRLLIIGQAPTEENMREAAAAISKVPHVREVINEVEAREPTSFSTRSNDTLITAKVKSTLLTHKNIKSNVFKVITENGVVYLFGLTTSAEAETASDLARSVEGVREVVLLTEEA